MTALDELHDTEDPTKPSLVSLAAIGHPFAIPWNHQEIAVLATFDSAHILDSKGPWLPSSPFLRTKDEAPRMVQHDDDGGSASFRDANTAQAESSTDHLSASLGVTVSVPFVSGNVTGKYDKLVTDKSHGSQASRNVSCRLGRLLLTRTPSFSPEATATLTGPNGRAKFKQNYGDFFVYGYVLGADAGACLSTNTSDTSSREETDVTVTVKVLFFKGSISTSSVTAQGTTKASLTFCGYNTLENDTSNYTAQLPADLAFLESKISSYLGQIAALEANAKTRLQNAGLMTGEPLDLNAGVEVCRSGLVAQLLLFPYALLEQYLAVQPTMSADDDSFSNATADSFI